MGVNRDYPWDALLIDPTDNKRAIKRAYAGLVKQTRPDDDAAEFQRLREAYEMALGLAEFGQIPVDASFSDAKNSQNGESDTIGPGVADPVSNTDGDSNYEKGTELFAQFERCDNVRGFENAVDDLIEQTSTEDFWLDPVIYESLHRQLVPYLVAKQDWIRQPIERLNAHFSWTIRLVQIGEVVGHQALHAFFDRLERCEKTPQMVHFNRAWDNFLENLPKLPEHLAINALIDDLHTYDDDESIKLYKKMVIGRLNDEGMTPKARLMLFDQFDLDRSLAMGEVDMAEHDLDSLRETLEVDVGMVKEEESTDNSIPSEFLRFGTAIVVILLVISVRRGVFTPLPARRTNTDVVRAQQWDFSDPGSMLHKGAERGSREMIRIALDLGVDIDLRGERGMTALMSSVANRHPYVTQLLLERGADPNIKDSRGWMALDVAVMINDTYQTKLLLMHGAQLGREFNPTQDPGTLSQWSIPLSRTNMTMSTVTVELVDSGKTAGDWAKYVSSNPQLTVVHETQESNPRTGEMKTIPIPNSARASNGAWLVSEIRGGKLVICVVGANAETLGIMAVVASEFGGRLDFKH